MAERELHSRCGEQLRPDRNLPPQQESECRVLVWEDRTFLEILVSSWAEYYRKSVAVRTMIRYTGVSQQAGKVAQTDLGRSRGVTRWFRRSLSGANPYRVQRTSSRAV